MSHEPETYTNFYLCPNDKTLWSDSWSCMCNDRCPTCRAEIEPYASMQDGEEIIHSQEVYDQASQIAESEDQN